jgi:hypothetical protein
MDSWASFTHQIKQAALFPRGHAGHITRILVKAVAAMKQFMVSAWFRKISR